MSTTTFKVTGMTCAQCEHAVSSEVGQIPDVQRVEVSAADRLQITSSTPMTGEQTPSSPPAPGPPQRHTFHAGHH